MPSEDNHAAMTAKRWLGYKTN